MPDETYHHAQPCEHAAWFCRALLERSDLSWSAKGLLVYLLTSEPRDTHVGLEQAFRQSASLEEVLLALRELHSLGEVELQPFNLDRMEGALRALGLGATGEGGD